MERSPPSAPISACRAAGLLLVLMSLQGCLAGAMLFGGAAALGIHEGFIAEETYEGLIRTTPGKAFDAATEVMDSLCHKIVVDKAFRTVSGSYGRTDLEVAVQDRGGGEVAVSVKARKYMLADKDSAMEVFQKILQKIQGY